MAAEAVARGLVPRGPTPRGGQAPALQANDQGVKPARWRLEAREDMAYKGESMEGEGRAEVRLRWETVGPDLVLWFSGAGEHVGAVALGDFDPRSGRAYVQCLSAPGHRDDLIARPMALEASRRLRGRVVAFGGIHLDDITVEERAQVVANAERLLVRFLESYPSIAHPTDRHTTR
jgi:hypothetical protein